MKKLLKSRKGITMLETVVTVALLAIMSGMLIGAWLPMAEMSGTVKSYEEGSMIAKVVMRYLEDKVRYNYMSNGTQSVSTVEDEESVTYTCSGAPGGGANQKGYLKKGNEMVYPVEFYGDYEVQIWVNASSLRSSKCIDITVNVFAPVKENGISYYDLVYTIKNTVDVLNMKDA